MNFVDSGNVTAHACGTRSPTARGFHKLVEGLVHPRAPLTQVKVSLDGYDSEEDVWLEPDSERLRPHEAGDVPTSGSSGGKRDAEAEAARLLSERRRAEASAQLSARAP